MMSEFDEFDEHSSILPHGRKITSYGKNAKRREREVEHLPRYNVS